MRMYLTATEHTECNIQLSVVKIVFFIFCDFYHNKKHIKIKVQIAVWIL